MEQMSCLSFHLVIGVILVRMSDNGDKKGLARVGSDKLSLPTMIFGQCGQSDRPGGTGKITDPSSDCAVTALDSLII